MVPKKLLQKHLNPSLALFLISKELSVFIVPIYCGFLSNYCFYAINPGRSLRATEYPGKILSYLYIAVAHARCV